MWFFSNRSFMKRCEMIKSKKDFNNIINNSKFKKNNFFVVYQQVSNYDIPKFGIAISKNFGNAVDRNKIKRQIRNIVDNNKYLFQNRFNYIIMVRNTVKKISYQEISNNLINLLKKENK